MVHADAMTTNGPYSINKHILHWVSLHNYFSVLLNRWHYWPNTSVINCNQTIFNISANNRKTPSRANIHTADITKIEYYKRVSIWKCGFQIGKTHSDCLARLSISEDPHPRRYIYTDKTDKRRLRIRTMITMARATR